MTPETFEMIFSPETLAEIFPRKRTSDFFDALFGDPDEGAYDIELAYGGVNDNNLTMELLLHERPGYCLACNLTQGLPQVFSRHPVIGINAIVEDINGLLGDRMECEEWSLGNTEQRSSSLHVIPIRIALRKN